MAFATVTPTTSTSSDASTTGSDRKRARPSTSDGRAFDCNCQSLAEDRRHPALEGVLLLGRVGRRGEIDDGERFGGLRAWAERVR